MERLDILVERIRRYTATQSFTDAGALGSQVGVQTQMIVDLFNEANHALHGIIYGNAPALYIKTATIDIASDTEEYTLPTDAFLGVNVLSVEYKYGDGSGDYYKIRKRDIHMRDTVITGEPQYYIQHNNRILLNPIPSTTKTAGIRVTYESQQPEVDVRRGTITAVDNATNPTSITIGTKSQADIAFAAGAAPEYITVVDKDGAQQMRNIAVSAYNSGTGVLTVSVSADAGESVSVGDYVVVGDNSSSHFQYPDFCEAFLTTYVKHSIFELLGHPSAATAARQLVSHQSLIMDVFADFNADIMEIPEHDESRIIDGW